MTTFRIARSFTPPLIALVMVPWVIHRYLEPLQFHNTWSSAFGIVLMVAGLTMLAWTNVLFVVYGQGTLAPWDPTKNLVIGGPYRYVRNPMILGAITTLLGETVLFASWWLFLWAILFTFICHLYFVLFEEPELEMRFGKDYIRYRNSTPRWIPFT